MTAPIGFWRVYTGRFRFGYCAWLFKDTLQAELFLITTEIIDMYEVIFVLGLAIAPFR